MVPLELRALVGKRELQEPLGADRRRALELLPRALARIGAKIDHVRMVLADQTRAEGFERVRRSAPMLSVDLAKMHYQERMALDLAYRQAGPSWASIGIDDRYVNDLRSVLAGRLSNEEIERVIGDSLQRYERRGNITAEPYSLAWRETAQVLAGAELAALERMVERDEGADPAGQVHPAHLSARVVDETPPLLEMLSLRGLLEDHLSALERQGRGRAGRKAWPRIFEDLIQFLAERRGLKGSSLIQADDVRRLTGVELTAWRDRKLETLSSKTVKDVWMASVKAALGRAVEDHKLDVDPSSRVKVRPAPRRVLRSKGYSEDEAVAVLTAARSYRRVLRENPRTSESAHIASAKRWGPWLCAFTGARVTEIMQLRRSDVLRDGTINFLRITPDAGSVKSGIFRDVPIHPQLIDEGFLDFVERAEADPLFYADTADKTKRPAETSSGRLSTWLKSSKLTPDGVQPNHAWRHRFKTISRDLGLDQRVVEAIQGHSARTAADGYGEVSLKAMYTVIKQIPRYEI